MGTPEGAERGLEEGTVGKPSFFIQWTKQAIPPSMAMTYLGLSGPRLTKGLGVVPAAPTPLFQVPEHPNPSCSSPPPVLCAE